MIDLDAMTSAERQAWVKHVEPAPKSKYRNTRCEYNSRIYDSIAEADRAAELDLLVKSGDVAWWLPQVRLPMPTWQATYTVDFLVAKPTNQDNLIHQSCVEVHAEDVKGMETQAFKRIKRLWAQFGPMPLHVIFKSGTKIIEGEACVQLD